MKSKVSFLVWVGEAITNTERTRESRERITLKVGHTVTREESHRTEEGFSSTVTEYSFDGEYVTRSTEYSGRDCDGRLDTYSTVRAHHLDLAAWKGGEPRRASCWYPKWERVEAWQRDHSAEAMNY